MTESSGPVQWCSCAVVQGTCDFCGYGWFLNNPMESMDCYFVTVVVEKMGGQRNFGGGLI